MIYKLYVYPILEFGCILFSGCAAYKLRPLILLERQALLLCVGLPCFVANDVLYLEAGIFPLESRLKQLTVVTFLKLYDASLTRLQSVFINNPDVFFRTLWRRYRQPHVVVVQTLLSKLHVRLPCLISQKN